MIYLLITLFLMFRSTSGTQLTRNSSKFPNNLVHFAETLVSQRARSLSSRNVNKGGNILRIPAACIIRDQRGSRRERALARYRVGVLIVIQHLYKTSKYLPVM